MTTRYTRDEIRTLLTGASWYSLPLKMPECGYTLCELLLDIVPFADYSRFLPRVDPDADDIEQIRARRDEINAYNDPVGKVFRKVIYRGDFEKHMSAWLAQHQIRLILAAQK